MVNHSSKQYDYDLEQIRSMVLRMGGIVEDQFRDALICLRNGSAKLADSIIECDNEVNQLEVTIDEHCSHLIVRRQPAANDLRTVMASIKVITDLERIGDEAAKIARHVKLFNDRTVTVINHAETLRVMSERVSTILRDALDAFARLDHEQAKRLIAQDEAIDHEFRTIMRSLITYMMEDPRTISASLGTLWVAKAMERIGDHAKNIAEYVIYVVEGLDVRHTELGGGSDLLAGK